MSGRGDEIEEKKKAELEVRGAGESIVQARREALNEAVVISGTYSCSMSGKHPRDVPMVSSSLANRSSSGSSVVDERRQFIIVAVHFLCLEPPEGSHVGDAWINELHQTLDGIVRRHPSLPWHRIKSDAKELCLLETKLANLEVEKNSIQQSLDVLKRELRHGTVQLTRIHELKIRCEKLQESIDVTCTDFVSIKYRPDLRLRLRNLTPGVMHLDRITDGLRKAAQALIDLCNSE